MWEKLLASKTRNLTVEQRGIYKDISKENVSLHKLLNMENVEHIKQLYNYCNIIYITVRCNVAMGWQLIPYGDSIATMMCSYLTYMHNTENILIQSSINSFPVKKPTKLYSSGKAKLSDSAINIYL